jgi:uncharacterized lipoprotein YddW (UPF0748 family)
VRETREKESLSAIMQEQGNIFFAEVKAVEEERKKQRQEKDEEFKRWRAEGVQKLVRDLYDE